MIYKAIVTIICFIIVSGAILFFPTNDLPDAEEDVKAEEKTEPKVADTAGETQEDDGVDTEEYNPPGIRILIKNQNDYYHQSVTLTSSSEWAMNGQPYAAGEAVEVGMENGMFSEEGISVSGEAGIQITSIERSQGIPIYPGNIRLKRGSQGILVINEVDVETYLQYVVPSEMPAAYEMEALKAQAVCARTYAYRNILDESLTEYGADVDDSVSYQVYNNLAPQERTNQAIQETAGEILTHEGEPITAYFFSTSCGHTSTDEVWNSSEGQAYLKSIYMGEEEDLSLETEEVFASFITGNTRETYEQEEKWYRWQVYLPIDYLNQRIASTHPGLGSFVTMEVQKRGTGGAVEELLVTGTKETLLITNEYDIRDFLAPGDNSITTNDGSDSYMSGLLPSAYFICETDVQADQTAGVQLTGGGYGHGVGLSQNGANNLAKNSKTYDDILNYFYQNIQIERLGA